MFIAKEQYVPRSKEHFHLDTSPLEICPVTLEAEMANASGFWGHSVPSLRRATFQSSMATQGSILYSLELIAKGVICSSATRGADKQAPGDSPTESGATRCIFL